METWDEIRREWLPGGSQPPFAPEVIVDGMAAARRLFGSGWPEEVAGAGRGPIYVSWIVSVGHRLDSIAHLTGAGQLVDRIAREGLRSSALAELAVAAALQARGYPPEIEPRPADRESPPDSRVTFDGQVVDIQVVQPEFSKEQAAVQPVLARISQGICFARGEEVLVEALVSWPITEAAELELLRAAAGEAAAVPGATIRLPGVGTLWISTPAPASESRNLLQQSVTRVEPPLGDDETAFVAPTFAMGEGSSRRRSYVEIRIPHTERLLKKLKAKREQLHRDGRGVIVMDVTRIPEGRRIASPLIADLFRQSGRVGAVILLDDGDGEVHAMVNPRARNPLPDGFVETLEIGLRQLIR